MTSERPDLLGSVLAFVCVMATLVTIAPRNERHRAKCSVANVETPEALVMQAQAFAEPHFQ